MEIQADGYGQVPEESEANNKSEFDHTATMLADLRGVSITTDTPVLYNGLKANLVVSVINDGPGRALDSTVKVYVGAATSPTASFALGRLKAGEIGTGSFTWTVVSGLTAFRVVVDANAVVPETKEDNNEGFFPF
jgi:subtilase family serine protease